MIHLIRTKEEKKFFMPWVEAYGTRISTKGERELVVYSRCQHCQGIHRMQAIDDRKCPECKRGR